MVPEKTIEFLKNLIPNETKIMVPEKTIEFLKNLIPNETKIMLKIYLGKNNG